MKKHGIIFLAVMLLMMIFSVKLSAEAANVKPKVTKISVTKSQTEAVNSETNHTVKVEYTWKNGTGEYAIGDPTYEPLELKVVSSNRSIVTVNRIVELSTVKQKDGSYKTTGSIQLWLKNNGKATITFSDPCNSRKYAKTNVNVITWADSIMAEDDIEVAVGGTITLNAKAVRASESYKTTASNQGVTYKLDSVSDVTGAPIPT